jgi:hypothetical protein
MGDSGEGLVDAESRIQERLEERERERNEKRAQPGTRDPKTTQAVESLRLARVELQKQLEATTHPARRSQIEQALAEIDRRMADLAR